MSNNINNLREKEIIEGITGRYIHGSNSSFGVVNIVGGSILPPHSHHHEQITFILEGELEMTIGGETMTLRAGDYFVIPSNVTHSAIAHRDCKLIDVFSPVREEYK